MLPSAHRMRRRSDFALAVKSGQRAAGRLLVLHGSAARPDVEGVDRLNCLVGFVVPRSVGNSVVRNRVQRRIRHLLATHPYLMPAGSALVVRVLPAASTASSSELESELESLMARLKRRWATERVEVRV